MRSRCRCAHLDDFLTASASQRDKVLRVVGPYSLDDGDSLETLKARQKARGNRLAASRPHQSILNSQR